MERQFLEGFGLEKQQIDSILNEHSRDIGAKVNEIKTLEAQAQDFQTTLNEYKEKLDSANSTITNLKNSNKDNENLQQKISDYQNQIKTMQASFDKERKDNAIINKLRENNFIDPELALNLIDTEKVIQAGDGTYSGLTEQIDAIVSNERYSYLIKQEQPQQVPTPEINRGGYDASLGIPDVQTATPQEKTLIGEVIGREFEEQAQQRQESAENFWKSLG